MIKVVKGIVDGGSSQRSKPEVQLAQEQVRQTLSAQSLKAATAAVTQKAGTDAAVVQLQQQANRPAATDRQIRDFKEAKEAARSIATTILEMDSEDLIAVHGKSTSSSSDSFLF